MKSLPRLAGFIPFLIMIFLNAFVDLGHKIVIQNTVFKVHDGQLQIILVAVVNALILLPFVFMFSPAGFISNRFARPRVMVASAWAALGLTLLITLFYYRGWYPAAFLMTLLLAVQSALYSPAKYGYIRELVGKENLAQVNGLVQAVTITAILSGVFAFSYIYEALLVGQAAVTETQILTTVAPLGWLLVACTVFELTMAYRLPVIVEGDAGQRFSAADYVSCRYLARNVSTLWNHRMIWLSIVGLSIFWGVSQVTLAAFPALAKEVLAETNTVVVQGILACSGIGIILGSLFAGSVSRHRIETGLVPVGAMGVFLALAVIPMLEDRVDLVLAFVALGLFGGMFIVPLNALIQFYAGEHSGTVLAGNNWVQNLTMLFFLAVTVVVALAGLDSRGLFYGIAAVALAGALYTVIKLPQSMVVYLLGALFRRRYHVDVQGLNHLPAEGGVLLLGNHISWLDWAMLQLACPRPIRFVMDRNYYHRWYLKWFLDMFSVIPITPHKSKEALQRVNGMLKAGEVVCLFPEGGISRTGQLAQFKRGFERTVAGVEGVIIPFYLHGLWGSRFSRCSTRLRDLRKPRIKRRVIATFGAPMAMASTAAEVKRSVFELSVTAWQRYAESFEPVPLAWMRSVKKRGRRSVLIDSNGHRLSAYKALTGAITLSHLIKQRSRAQNIGLMLPTSSAGILANMAVLLLGRSVVNLNYTASMAALKDAVAQAEIGEIYTSRKFVDKLVAKGMDVAPLFDGLKVYYLEELAEGISGFKKLLTFMLVKSLPAGLLYRLYGHKVAPDSTAAVLFSSGSEGSPKGVVLSHRGLMSNVKQNSDVLDVLAADVVMGSLPLFHAFGLTVTAMMPLVEGVPVVCHPDPTDVAAVAKAIGRYKATLYFGTSTFLGLMSRNRRVTAEQLGSLRYVVSGAERLRPEVQRAFSEKFNKTIYEGYGATETGPVAGCNLPDVVDERNRRLQQGSKEGSVGLPLPGTSYRIVDPVTLERLPSGEDGLILIAGMQLALGYLNDPESTREAFVELDGLRWYKSGDKGHLDEDGFLTIVDRYSRFAKLGGEMVSLTAVEEQVQGVIGDTAGSGAELEVAAVALPDARKGEKVVLLVTGAVDPHWLQQELRRGINNPLMIPAVIRPVEFIPKLGSGKNDFVAMKRLALSLEQA